MLSHETFTLWIAVAWFTLLLVVALGYLIWHIRHSPYTLWEDVLYLPTYLFGRLLWRVHFTNQPPSEMRRGGVLVANHRSSVDPFFVQLSAGRRVHWMVAREYCENPILKPLLRALQVIPTNRSGMDTGATKLAIRLAKEGRLVGMFPEGRLNHTRGPLVSIRPGAALVAVRAAVPLIPLYIAGSPYRREVWSPLLMSARVTITFGQPIDPQAFAAQNAPLAAEEDLIESTDSPSRLSKESAAPESQEHGGSPRAAEIGDPPSASGAMDRDRGNTGRASDRDNGGEDRGVEQSLAEQLMVQWGKQIVTLAGRPDWPIEIAGRSRLNRKRKRGLDE